MPRPAFIRLSWPGPDRLDAAETVAVLNLALDQPGHRLQAGVRVRRHLHARPPGDVIWPEMIDEAPRANHPTWALRQEPAHRRVPAQRYVMTRQEHALRLGDGGQRAPVHRRVEVTPDVAHCSTLQPDACVRKDRQSPSGPRISACRKSSPTAPSSSADFALPRVARQGLVGCLASQCRTKSRGRDGWVPGSGRFSFFPGGCQRDWPHEQTDDPDRRRRPQVSAGDHPRPPPALRRRLPHRTRVVRC